MFDGQSILEIIKLGFRPRIALAFWLTPLAIFSLPDPWAEYVHIQTFRDEYGAFMTIAFILFFLLWIIELVCFFSPQIYNWHLSNVELKQIITCLNKDEKSVLAKFLLEDTCTRRLDPDWHETQSLARKSIIDVDCEDFKFVHVPYSITPKAWAYLKKNKKQFLNDAIQGNPELKEWQGKSNA